MTNINVPLIVHICLICMQNIWTVASQPTCSTEDAKVQWNSGQDIEAWRLCTHLPPHKAKLWPSVGNGHVAMVVHSDTVYMNGLYNGNGTQSTRARIPALTSVNVSDISLPYTGKSYCLHMDNGIYVETYTGDQWNLELKVYGHRTISRLLVTELRVRATGNHQRLQISVSVNAGTSSKDIDFKDAPSGLTGTKYMYGRTKVSETPASGRTPVHVYYSRIPDRIIIESGISADVRHTLLMSVGPDQNETKLYYEQGLSMITNTSLESTHVKAWHEVWDSGRVDIYGNSILSALTHSSLYYILSAMPTIEEKTWPFIGLSPSDLAHNGYNGHVFWDQDTWMFPPILLLNSDLGKILVNTRIRALEAAKEYARRSAFKGARYPWESALSGFDVTPSKACGRYEIHVSGDVAMAFQQYLMVTEDEQIPTAARLKEAIFDIAEFWVSRSTYNNSLEKFEILDVMPPDEWHFPINNSVYTNTIAQKSLRLPAYVCERIGCTAPPLYEDVANKIKIPFDTELQYHPEYDGYNTSIYVKQADAILLGWPLEVDMSELIRRNDLEMYAQVTPGGPAMSWGMYSIGWIEVSEHEKANTTFYEQQKNRQDPFNIWTEDADGGGVTNFITGMGGYLQSLIFGYAGIRFGKNNLIVNCSPLPDTSAYRLKGFDYLGNSVDITCDQASTKITLVRGDGLFRVALSKSAMTVDLHVGNPICVARQKLIITKINSRLSPTTPSMSTPVISDKTVSRSPILASISYIWSCLQLMIVGDALVG